MLLIGGISYAIDYHFHLSKRMFVKYYHLSNLYLF